MQFTHSSSFLSVHRVAPVYEKLATENDGVTFIHVDVDELGSLEDASDVSGVPTFKFFKGGKLLSEFSGANQDKLKQTIAANK